QFLRKNSMAKKPKCMFDFRELPLEAYVLPGENNRHDSEKKFNRKWRTLAIDRQRLVSFLATYANADGSQVETGIQKMQRNLGVPRDVIYRRLADVKQLGMVSTTGRISMRGCAVRQLTAPKPTVADSGAKVADSQKPELQIGVATVADRQARVADSPATVAD